MRDASLDEFIGGDEDESEDREVSPADGGGDDGVDESESVDSEASESTPDASEADPDDETPVAADSDTAGLTVTPAQATYEFSPDGAECAACGTTVETRWHDPETGMVCGACKSW